jgi:hypothetical protein
MGRDISQTLSCRPRTVNDGVRSQVSPWRICGAESDTGTGSFFSALPFSVISSHFTTPSYSFIYHKSYIAVFPDFFFISRETPLKTFTEQKKLVVGSVIQLRLNYIHIYKDMCVCVRVCVCLFQNFFKHIPRFFAEHHTMSWASLVGNAAIWYGLRQWHRRQINYKIKNSLIVANTLISIPYIPSPNIGPTTRNAH